MAFAVAASAALAFLAAAFLRREILAVQAFLQFLVGGVAHRLHLAGEVERLAGHGVVEIHRHAVVEDIGHGALDHLPVLVHHRDHPADDQEVFPDLAVYGESLFRDGDHIFGMVFAVSLFCGQGELEGLSGFLAFHGGLELRKEHSGSVDVFERRFRTGLVCDNAFNLKFVGEGGHFVLFYLHISR